MSTNPTRTEKTPHRLTASVTLEWWHGDPAIRGTLTVIAVSKADRDALREFAEYVGAEARGPVMRVVFPKRPG